MNLFRRTSNRRRRAGFSLRAETPAGGDSGRRRLAWPVKAAGLLVVLAGAWLGFAELAGIAKDRWLGRIEALSIRRLVITRDGILTETDIQRMTGVNPGRNALSLDLFEIRQRLLRHPRIADVVLHLEFPDTLYVDVRERTPVARSPLPGMGSNTSFYLLDDQGRTMLPAEAGAAPPERVESEAALPLLTGLSSASFLGGETLTDPQARAALQLLALLENGGAPAPADLVSIDVGAPGSLAAITSRGERITFAPDDLPRQVRDWGQIEQRAAGLGRSIAALDLSVRQNIPLRWSETNTPAPAPRTTPHPTRRLPPRRHV